jgi:hypothetical protein
MSIIAITIVSLLAIVLSKFTYTKIPRIIRIFIPIGLIILIISVLSIIIPIQYFPPGDDYHKTVALSSLYYGIIGFMTSAVLIGYSLGKRTIPLEKEVTQLNE